MIGRRRHNPLCNRKGMLGCKCGDVGGLFTAKGNNEVKNAGQGITQAGTSISDASKLTPQEQQQYQGSFDIGSFLKQLFGSQLGMNAVPSGAVSGDQQFQNQGQLEQQLYNTTLQNAKNPDAQFMSTLQPQLQQAQDSINSYYQKRGLLNSGLAIGSMGQAGVDLAIQQAQAMMQNRQQQFQNAQSVSQGIMSNQQTNFGNLANLYSQQQGFGLQSLGRQSQGAEAAAGYQAYPYQAQLGQGYADINAGAQQAGMFGPVWGNILGGPQGGAYGTQNLLSVGKAAAATGGA